MKRLFIFIAAIFAAAVAFGQTPLPNDPEVRVGKLDNGMTYYIRHNDQPAQRAEFYLATDVGAYQEADDQDGLAHFLEHMCFNGTKNFPGKSLLEWPFSRADRGIGGVRPVAPPTWLVSNFLVRPASS